MNQDENEYALKYFDNRFHQALKVAGAGYLYPSERNVGLYIKDILKEENEKF